MIFIKLQGGLGNQMFQYATAYAISKNKNYRLKLDISFYRNSINRFFVLNEFQISAQTQKCASLFFEKVIRRIVPSKFHKKINFIPPYNRKIIKEKSVEYDPSVFDLPDNIYLDGYWQSDKYFLYYHDEIVKEFSFKHLPDGINARYARDISSENSVSLHIRKGDYISRQSNTKIYAQCTLDYYQDAVNYISERVGKPVFYIFSDDPEWALKNLKISSPTVYITHNQQKEYEDLRLMSLCKYNIIANSTFSWWGAWLNKNQEKIVIAPLQWFVNGEKTDIIPKEWICI